MSSTVLKYAEAASLADLVPSAWLIVGRQWSGMGATWLIPRDEVAKFEHNRDDGLIVSALLRDGASFLILARQLRNVPEARPTFRRRISEV